MLGVHCSVSGGLQNAFTEAEEKEINVFQIFSRNQRQWRAKPISDEEKQVFDQSWDRDKINLIFTHASYLINLGSEKEDLWQKSTDALTAELERCEALGLSYTVLHPGAAGEQTEEEAIKRISEGLKNALKNTEGFKTMILLENTAGQGSALGWKFEHIRDIMNQVQSERIGTCFDTCHAFAAGYDIRTKAGFEDTMADLDKVIGLNKLKAFHLNDSKQDFASRKDRHEHIGQGKIGLAPFREIMQQFAHIPKVLETPKDNNMDFENLKTLRAL